jgi:outer membrane lipoprotein-sorting protein
MTNEEMTDINEKYEGSIKIKGKKYMVNIPEYGVKIISNGNTLWNYMETGNQVTISSVDEEGSELMDPSSLFTIYEKGFSSKYIDEKSKNGKKVHEIELYPDGDQYGVAKIVVFINSSTLLIDSAVLNELEGNKYTIEVEKMETNHSFPDSDFTFDATEYPDVEVIDFR